jgi:predicted RNA-binding Zn-ribbon protein involved in translation (DUF1610 family)
VAAHEPDALRNPLPVGEIIQRMMPYRACRAALGLETAEDYELLMLRMLAEEEGLVTVWPPESAERCRVEVAAVLPDLAFLQAVLESTIRVNVEALERVPPQRPPSPPDPSDPADPVPEERAEDAGEGTGEDRARQSITAESVEVEDADQPVEELPEPASAGLTPEPAPALELAEVEALIADLELDLNARGLDSTSRGEPEPVVSDSDPAGNDEDGETDLDDPPVAPAPPTVVWAAPEPTAEVPQQPLACPHCDASLPRGRAIRFCPNCGQNVRTRRCASCRAELEPPWRHCVMCGHPAGDPSRFA